MVDFAGLVASFGYIGIFLVSLIGSATIIFPLPAFALVVAAASQMNPFWVGIAAGLGATIGEFTGYALGFGISHVAKKKRKEVKKKLEQIRELFRKYHPELVIFFFAATPLPFDFVGMLCGTMNYDRKRFFLATLAGKLIKYLLIAYAGFYGINWVLDIMGFG